jgi:hypothetical protein
LINNRQGGRRRGRGGQRPQNIGGRPDGNRQDNRQRGNAAQLLEKYKSMARDAQLAGDRVQTEYYLQFADHYFRVLGESRARFEEQRPQRSDEFEDDGNDDDQFDGDGEQGSDDDRQDRQDRSDRQERQPRSEQPRGDREDRPDRPQRDRPRRVARDDNADERSERPERSDRPERTERPQANGRESANVETLPFDALPPAIGASAAPTDEEETAPVRRRTRRPRPASDEGEIAPAA